MTIYLSFMNVENLLKNVKFNAFVLWFLMSGNVIVTITFPSISSYIPVVQSAAVLPAQIQPTCMYT